MDFPDSATVEFTNFFNGEVITVEEQGTDKYGIAKTTILTSHKPEDTYASKVKLLSWKYRNCGKSFNPDKAPVVESGPLIVVPGDPVTFELVANREEVPADEKSYIEIDIKNAKDAFDNTVADGSIIGWQVEATGNPSILSADTGTVGGNGKMIMQAGFLNEEINVSSQIYGDWGTSHAYNSLKIISKKIEIFTNSIPSLDISGINQSNATITTDASAGTGLIPADGSEVNYFLSNGGLSQYESITIGGKTTTLLAAQNAMNRRALFAVSVVDSMQATWVSMYSAGEISITVDTAAIAGNATTPGVVTVPQLDDTTVDYPYKTTSKVTIQGKPNAAITLRLKQNAGETPLFEARDIEFPVDVTDATIETTLDSTGKREFFIDSKGIQFVPPGQSAVLNRVDVEATAIESEASASHQIAVANDTLLGKSADAVKNGLAGFIMGDTDTAAGVAGDIAASVCIWGDIRDLFIQIGRLWPGGEEPDLAVLTFSTLGLALEAVPGFGEVADGIVATLKTLIKRLPTGPLRAAIVRFAKKVMKTISQGTEAVFTLLKNYVEWIKQLTFLPKAQLDHINEVFKYADGKALDLVDNIFDVAAGLARKNPHFTTALANVAQQYGAAVGERLIRTLRGNIDDAVIANLDEAAFNSLGKVLHNLGSNGDRGAVALNRAFHNKLAFTDVTGVYPPKKFCENMGKLVDDGFTGVERLVYAFAANSKAKVRGHRYEMDIALAYKNRLGMPRELGRPFPIGNNRFSDLDITDAITIQAKVYRTPVPAGLLVQWINRVHGQLGIPYNQLVVVVANGVKTGGKLYGPMLQRLINAGVRVEHFKYIE